MERMALALVVVLAVFSLLDVHGAEVQMMEEAQVGPAYGVHGDMSKQALRDASDTFATVKRKVTHRGFNILGFFGCCYHCKHDPSCTSDCMARHHIQNGFESTEEATQESSEELSQQRLLNAAGAVAFIQESAGRDHKPIKLHLNEGSSKYHDAPERPQESGDSKGAESGASRTLVSEEDDSKHFRTNEFFHCAFSCKHEVSCEEGCLSRHHMGMPNSDRSESSQLGADDDDNDPWN